MTWFRQKSRWRDAESLSAVFLAGAGVLALVLTQLPGGCVPRCMLKLCTGVPCFTCGGFRACQALLAGHVADALRLQPLLTCLAGLALLWVWYALVGSLCGWSRLRVQTTRRERVLLAAIAALVAFANWIYLVAAGV